MIFVDSGSIYDLIWETEMKDEWVTRGFDLEDFTVEKLQEIWKEEARLKALEMKREMC